MNTATNDSGLCSYAGKNNTAISYLHYGGIPQNMLYNVLFWVVSTVHFDHTWSTYEQSHS